MHLTRTKIEAAITPKTKAIIPVHLYGQCADMIAIKKIADKHKLKVIEDNAQAIGAAGPGFKIGELSDAATTSFIIQKNLGTFGDSGALVTNNADIDAAVRRLRNHGSTARNVHSYGFNSRLDDLHAGVLSAKLKHIDAVERPAPQVGRPLHRRPARAARPSTCRSNCPATATSSTSTSSRPRRPSGATSWWISWSRTAWTPRPTTRIAIHKQAGYPWGKDARIVGTVANAEANAACCVSLPMFPELTAEEVDYVIAKVKEWDKANAAAGPAGNRAAQCGATCACCK